MYSSSLIGIAFSVDEVIGMISLSKSSYEEFLQVIDDCLEQDLLDVGDREVLEAVSIGASSNYNLYKCDVRYRSFGSS